MRNDNVNSLTGLDEINLSLVAFASDSAATMDSSKACASGTCD